MANHHDGDESNFLDVWYDEERTPSPSDSVSPVIVPPVPNKPITRISLFRYLWSRAIEHLSEAQEITICGYSLPETDKMAISLFEKFSNENLKQITVVDPSAETLHKWRSLLRRRNVSDAQWTYYEDFEEYVQRLTYLLTEHGQG
ncbi:MAG: hypothetical protein Kow00133_12020 [Amphiplicatus sp.]